MLKRVWFGIFVLVAAGVFFVAAAGWGLYWWAKQPLAIASQQIIVIQQGETLTSTVNRLAADSIIPVPELALLYSKIEQKTHIQYGEYQLRPGLSWAELNDLFLSGDVIERNVTLVEGWTIAATLQALKENEKIDSVLDGINDPKLTSLLPPEHPHPEGWFFADTYSFRAGDTDLSILTRAHKKMRDALTLQWQEKSNKLPFKTAYEGLILASIIEKETGVAAERPVISGVFVRRLQKNMRLQTDPTVIYGLGEQYKGNITRKNLRQPTPYNTYVIPALPPTPIALVGQAALDAAFHPAPGSELYFVAKGDGSHQFSDTLSDHNKAVREYQIVKRKKDYRSTPDR